MALQKTLNIIYLSQKTEIVFVFIDKTIIKIFKKYIIYLDLFFRKTIAKLPKYIMIINYLIILKENEQLFYKFIYNLGFVELETLKTYI